MNYKDWHKSNPFVMPRLEKKASDFSNEELTEARGLIALYNKKGKIASKAIKALMEKFGKDEAAAARVYWTETKRADVKATSELGDELGITKYKVILSPNACKVCRKKTENGNKVFDKKQVEKAGVGKFVPFHPNCYCIMVPYE